LFAVWILALVVAPPARAQGVSGRDSVATVVADSAGVEAGPEAAPADTAVHEAAIVTTPLRARRTLPKLGRLDQPRWVMLRSLLLPGWGQVHNRAWIKAALLMAGDGALRVRFLRDERHLRNVGRQADHLQSGLLTATADTVSAWDALVVARQSGDTSAVAAAEAARLATQSRFLVATDEYNGFVPIYNALLDRTINRRWILGGVVLYALIDAYVDAHFQNFDVNLELDPALPGGTVPSGGRLQLRWSF
jgi:hypothetical protein